MVSLVAPKKIKGIFAIYNTIKDYISYKGFNNFDAPMTPTHKPAHLTSWYFG
jgi:hypothetical protein